jgi:hypothetical protein
VIAVWRQRGALRPADKLFISWAVAVVVFFSLSQSKLPGYILTAAIALGVLVARLLRSALRPSAGRARDTLVRHAAFAFALVAAVLAVAAVLPVAAPDLIAGIAPRPARYLGALETPLRWLAGLFACAAVGSMTAFLRRDRRLASLVFMVFPLGLIPVLTAGMNPYVQHRSAKALMQGLPELGPDTLVVCYHCYPNGWSFYSKRYVSIVTASEGYELQSNYIRFALQQSPVWPERMIRDAEFSGWLAGLRVPAMLLVKTHDAAALRALVADRGAVMNPITDEFAGALLLPREM